MGRRPVDARNSTYVRLSESDLQAIVNGAYSDSLNNFLVNAASSGWGISTVSYIGGFPPSSAPAVPSTAILQWVLFEQSKNKYHLYYADPPAS